MDIEGGFGEWKTEVKGDSNWSVSSNISSIMFDMQFSNYVKEGAY